MSESSGGDGWWQASDGKWYPPELHPDAQWPNQPSVPAFPTSGLPGGNEPAAPPVRTGRPVTLVVAAVAVLVGAAIVAVLVWNNDDNEVTAGSAPVVGPAAGADPSDTTDGAESDGPGDSGDSDQSSGPVGGLGSFEEPAALGTVFVQGNWAFTVTGLSDPIETGVLADFAEDPGPGNVYVLVTIDATYLGETILESPLLVPALHGSREYDAFGNDCILDLTEVESLFDFLPGQSGQIAQCFEVPAIERDDLVALVTNVEAVDMVAVHFSERSDATRPPPDLVLPSLPDVDTLGLGTIVQIDEFDVTVSEVADAIETGRLADFSDPPGTGNTFVYVEIEVTYTGTAAQETPFFTAVAVGSRAYEPFDNACLLDFSTVSSTFDYEPGDTGTIVFCYEVPSEEVDGLLVALRGGLNRDTVIFADE